MLRDKTFAIALIPARGGSKGILRKNLTPLDGKPLIAHTLEAAQRAMLIDEIWVSSDDTEILTLATAHAVRTIVRPSELSGDNASPVEVVNHFIASLPENIKQQNPVIVYLQPTSPLRDEVQIDSALRLMEANGADGVMSVVEACKPPHKAFCLDSRGCLASLFDERMSNARRQDLPQCYYPNGAIYAFRIKTFLERQGFPSNGSLPFIMSEEDSIDVDDINDLVRAEIAIRKKNGRI